MFERRRTSGRFIRTSFSGAWSACLAVAIASPAVAHPHNRIGVEAVVMIEAGAVTALKYGWHFDRAYLEGLKDQYDKDHDSTISDEELQVWLANSIKTLDTFGSFTTLRLGREPLAVGHSDGHRAERSDSGITLHFTLHLARPAVLKVTSLQIDLFDRSFFTEFVLGAGHGITVQAVRSGTCSASVALAPNSEQQRAITAFMKSFGRIDANLAPARSITVTCRD